MAKHCSLFQMPSSTWPEDEARAEAKRINQLIEEDADFDYIDTEVAAICPHWEKVFSSEQDATILMREFVAEFNSKLPERFHVQASV